jgi:hypothetical protein
MLPHKVIYLFHMFFVAPLFVYLWYRGSYQGKPISKDLLNIVGLFGVVIFLYHGYKLYSLY